nr:glycoside hydrolase family 88 protein [Hoylesella saccharolytica]
MLLLGVCAQAQTSTAGDVEAIIEKVNDTWQAAHPQHERAFWDNAVYHTGNMSAYALLQKRAWAEYSEAWAKHNLWQGARETNPAKWKYKNYGEGQDYVLFGDWQICFQTYIDLYNLQPEPNKIARAKEVMDYEAASDVDDYWWWADALYMVMPVMTKMYKLTGDIRYLDKMYDNWKYANKIMYDKTTGLYFRDGKYVFPAHKSVNGKKDFWSRGDGWVMAAFAKVLADLPQNAPHRSEYIRYYRKMAKTVAQCQQKEGYWTRSLLDPEHAPGPESSGTSLFTFALFYGINNGYLSAKKYLSVAERAWNYLATTALQPDGTVGYMQPIGEKAIPGQVVGRTSVTNFGTGAFLLAACEYARYQRARQR